ncbi:MAG: hypothetical protein C4294_19990 [Nitrospiraceae bacterium]
MNASKTAIRGLPKKRLLLLALALVIAGAALAQPSREYLQEIPYNITLSFIMGPPPHPINRNISFSSSLGIICVQCRPTGGARAGGGDMLIRGSPTLSFTLMLAIIAVPALLLARAVGPPGLFVGLLIGGGLAFMAGLLPLWLLVLLGLAVITLIGLMIRGRQE